VYRKISAEIVEHFPCHCVMTFGREVLVGLMVIGGENSSCELDFSVIKIRALWDSERSQRHSPLAAAITALQRIADPVGPLCAGLSQGARKARQNGSLFRHLQCCAERWQDRGDAEERNKATKAEEKGLRRDVPDRPSPGAARLADDEIRQKKPRS